jgi:hypothetical protein
MTIGNGALPSQTVLLVATVALIGCMSGFKAKIEAAAQHDSSSALPQSVGPTPTPMLPNPIPVSPAPMPAPSPTPNPIPATTPPGLPAGWNLDPSMSDDFTNDGGVFDHSKWITVPHPNNGDGVNCVLNYNPTTSNIVDSEGMHIKTTHTGGINWDQGDMVVGAFRTPANYYMEFRWRPDFSGGTNNPDFWTWGNCGPKHFCEIDWPEYGWIQWYFWNGLIENSNFENNDTNNVRHENIHYFWPPDDGQFHTHGKLRLNGVQYFYLDGIQVYSMPDPFPEFDIASDFPQMWSGVQGGCPSVPADTVWQYIRTYHP